MVTMWNDVEAMRLFIEYGADITAQDKEGSTFNSIASGVAK